MAGWLGTAASRLTHVACFPPPLAFVATLLLIPASQAPASAATPAHVKIGLSIMQLTDFDLPGNSFVMQFWIWFLHTDPAYKPLNSIDFINAKETEAHSPSTTPRTGVAWEGRTQTVLYDVALYRTKIEQIWNVTNYPFDRQTLELRIEDDDNDAAQIVFEPDLANSGIDDSVLVPGWTIKSFTMQQELHVYNTTYGDPAVHGPNVNSRLIGRIVLERQGWGLLFGTFGGFFVAFLLTTLTYAMDIRERYDARVGLCAGAIFAVVGTNFAVSSALPPPTGFALVDAIATSSLASIIVAMISIVVLGVLVRRNPPVVHRANSICAIVSIVTYLGFNTAMIRAAMQ